MIEGAEIGKYRLEHRIAQGGMAEVWAATVRGPGLFIKPIALKFILAHLDEDPECKRLFTEEAKIAAALNHANLLTVFDFDQAPADCHPSLAGKHFIAMERVEGGSLWQLIRAAHAQGQGLPESVVAHVGVEALRGLSYLHEYGHLGLIHRDVSPQNLLLTRTGQVKVSDFGIAKATARLAAHHSGLVRGKVPYLSPEVLDGQPASALSDQFAVGVVLWEAFTGRDLFNSESDGQTIDRIRRCEVPSSDSLHHGTMSPTFDAVVRRMLSRNPADRFPTTAEALEALIKVPTYDASHVPLGRLVRSLLAGGVSAPVRLAIGPQQTKVIPATKVLPDNVGERAVPRTEVLSAPPPVAPLQGEDASTSPQRGQHERAPKRHKNLGFVPGFTRERLAENLQRAIERFERQRAESTVPIAFEDWVITAGAEGVDPVHGCQLPINAALVFKWPRFIDLGWRRHLTCAWYGPQPWGKDGYWVAEDNLADEAMVLFANDLNRPLFSQVPQQTWIKWWSDREVDIAIEGPGGSLPPISLRARELLAPGETPPLDRHSWLKLWSDRDPASAGTETIRKLAKGEGAPQVRQSIWQRLFNIVQK